MWLWRDFTNRYILICLQYMWDEDAGWHERVETTVSASFLYFYNPITFHTPITSLIFDQHPITFCHPLIFSLSSFTPITFICYTPTIKSLMLTQLECYDIKMTLQSLNHRNRHMIKQFGRLLAVNITFNTINMVPRFPKSRFIRKEGRKQGQYWTVTYAFCFYNLMIPCYQRNLKAIFDIWNEEGLGIKEEAFNCPLYTAWNKTADLGLYLKAGFFATGVIYWDAPKS